MTNMFAMVIQRPSCPSFRFLSSSALPFVSAMRSTAVFRGTKLHVDFKNSHSFVRGKSSLAVARKRHILQREDYLSVDEAIGDRCPPPIESYDNGEDFFAANIPTASPIDQTQQIPSPPKSSTAPNFAAIPDFNEASSSLLNEDEDFFDDEEPRVVEQAVIDDLSYHTDATTVLSSNQRPAPTLFGKSFSSVATPDNVAEEMDVNISLKPKYKPPTVEELEMTMETVLNEITTHNNGKPVNPNSNKQVATLLFGTVGGSTKKDVLEGMAGAGNRMADLILKYREAKFKLGKMRRRNDSFAKGTAVKSALTVKRVYNETFSEDDDQRDPLILVDASAYIFRAYYSMPPIHRSDGMPTGAVMGFCKMLNAMLLDSMMEGKQPRLVLCFDAKGKTFRHKMFPNYKGNRPAAPMDLVPQFDFVRQAADAYGIAQIEAYGYEADDVIATLATRAVQEGVDANILSGDKDLMQLVTDLGASPSIQMTDPMKRDCSTYKEVVAKWDVGPRLLGDVLALAGDTADNVPGVKGIGVKTAAKLINEYGSLDNLLANIPNIKQNGVRNKLEAGQHDARLSRQLVELCRDVPLEELVGLPIEVAVSELRMEPLNVGRILGFYESMGFRELQATLKSKLKGTKTERKASTRRFKTEVPRPEDYADVPF